MDAPMASRPQDRMMQARQPVAPQEAPPQANPMELIAQLTPEAVESMSEDDAKGTLMEIATMFQDAMASEAPAPAPAQPPM